MNKNNQPFHRLESNNCEIGWVTDMKQGNEKNKTQITV